MQMRRRGQGIGFTDLLFNATMGLFLLLVIALTMINPIAEKADIEHKAEMIVILTWNEDTGTDLDTWVIGPGMRVPVSYINKEVDYITLDRDDLGEARDKMTIRRRSLKISSNQEITSIRGAPTGRYFVSVNIYHVDPRDHADNKTFEIKVIDLNPRAKVIYSHQGDFVGPKREMPIIAFDVGDDGQVSQVSEEDAKPLVTSKRVQDLVP